MSIQGFFPCTLHLEACTVFAARRETGQLSQFATPEPGCTDGRLDPVRRVFTDISADWVLTRSDLVSWHTFAKKRLLARGLPTGFTDFIANGFFTGRTSMEISKEKITGPLQHDGQDPTFRRSDRGSVCTRSRTGLAHLYIGEEAVAAGACAVLREDDYITSTHRGHGHVIAKGRTSSS